MAMRAVVVGRDIACQPAVGHVLAVGLMEVVEGFMRFLNGAGGALDLTLCVCRRAVRV